MVTATPMKCARIFAVAGAGMVIVISRATQHSVAGTGAIAANQHAPMEPTRVVGQAEQTFPVKTQMPANPAGPVKVVAGSAVYHLLIMVSRAVAQQIAQLSVTAAMIMTNSVKKQIQEPIQNPIPAAATKAI